VNPFLRQPSADQRTPIRAERPSPKAADDGVVALRLYDAIDSWGGSWGVSAKEFVTVLDGLPDDTHEIRLLINSPGGECWEGLAILNALRAHPARVVAIVEGIAASAASFIAAGVDELHMMANSELFVHKAWGLAVGSAEVMHKCGDDLGHEDRNLASIYAGKAGGSVDDWLAAMSAKTFYSADEAVEAGLADKVVEPAKEGDDAVSKAKARFDLSIFDFAGRDHAPAPTMPAARRGPANHNTTEDDVSQRKPAAEPAPDSPVTDPSATPPSDAPEAPAVPAPEPEPTPDPEGGTTNVSLTAFRSRLGLDETADEASVLAALDNRLKPTQPAPEILAAVAATEAKFAAAIEQITNLSTELAEVKAEKAEERKTAFFNTMVREGRIAPADRASWEARYDRDSDLVTEILGAIKPGTAVPVAMAGYVGDQEPGANDDDLWALMPPEMRDAESSKAGA
jgi:ATP-dependent protease ClpP protease subunit